MSFCLSTEALPKAVDFVPTNFVIKTDSAEYPCHLLLVASQSTHIATLLLDDPELKEYTLQTPDPDGYFQLVIDLINQKYIEIDTNNAMFLNSAADELKMPELIHACRKYLPDLGKNTNIEFDPLHPFKGVISYFSPIEDESEIKVEASSSSYYGDVHNLLLQDRRPLYWESEDRDGSYVEFDLINKQLEVNAYSLRSNDVETDELDPKSWILAGSNDHEDWQTLHQIDNTMDLYGSNAEGFYEVESQGSFRYLRVQITGPNHRGNFILRLARVEFYGRLSEL